MQWKAQKKNNQHEDAAHKGKNKKASWGPGKYPLAVPPPLPNLSVGLGTHLIPSLCSSTFLRSLDWAICHVVSFQTAFFTPAFFAPAAYSIFVQVRRNVGALFFFLFNT